MLIVENEQLKQKISNQSKDNLADGGVKKE
jgi:hypothetical protein